MFSTVICLNCGHEDPDGRLMINILQFSIWRRWLDLDNQPCSIINSVFGEYDLIYVWCG